MPCDEWKTAEAVASFGGEFETPTRQPSPGAGCWDGWLSAGEGPWRSRAPVPSAANARRALPMQRASAGDHADDKAPIDRAQVIGGYGGKGIAAFGGKRSCRWRLGNSMLVPSVRQKRIWPLSSFSTAGRLRERIGDGVGTGLRDWRDWFCRHRSSVRCGGHRPSCSCSQEIGNHRRGGPARGEWRLEWFASCDRRRGSCRFARRALAPRPRRTKAAATFPRARENARAIAGHARQIIGFDSDTTSVGFRLAALPREHSSAIATKPSARRLGAGANESSAAQTTVAFRRQGQLRSCESCDRQPRAD